MAFLFLGAVYYSNRPFLGFVFVCFIVGCQSLALWEYYQLAKAKGFAPLAFLGVGVNVVYVLTTYFSRHFAHPELLPNGVLIVALAMSFLCFFRKGSQPLGNLAITVFGLAYLTPPLICIININYFVFSDIPQDGRVWLVYLFFVTKITDMGAYFFGKTFGKRPLAPTISPKKTMEGAFGGMVCAVATSIIFYGITQSFASPAIQMTFWQSIWLGIILSVIAQFGDLAESLLKRDADVKDSSHLPGLGGFLDIADSIVFTAPLLYLFLKLGTV